jgi:nicotinamidase-related amidase
VKHADPGPGVKRHERILSRERSLLLVVDLQESYRGKLHEEARVLRGVVRLLRAAGILGVPVLLTEQYPKGLGLTREDVAAHLPASCQRFEKVSFSALGAPGLPEALARLGRDQVVLAGIETHVCISQTAHDLLARGLQVHLVRDAVTARFPLEDEAGAAKMFASGAAPTSSEQALFEWLERAGTPEFKAIHALVV